MNPTILIVLIVVVAMLLTLKGNSKSKPIAGSSQNDWIIGPIINGKSLSIGMPTSPTLQGQGWSLAFPGPTGELHSVANFKPPSLIGAHQLTARFAITGGGFVVSEFPGKTPLVSVMLQRRGDNWTADGVKQSYRWYSKQPVVLQAGEFALTVPLTLAGLSDVYGKSDNQAALDATLHELSNIAIAFGHDSGVSHGVYATQPSRFTLLELSAS